MGMGLSRPQPRVRSLPAHSRLHLRSGTPDTRGAPRATLGAYATLLGIARVYLGDGSTTVLTSPSMACLLMFFSTQAENDWFCI